MHFHNYRDFYQKVPIPMNSFDLATLENTKYTHWLIALEGEEQDGKRHFYNWRICIYKTDETGSFSHKHRQYMSEEYQCFHTAYTAANEMERKCKTEGFFSNVNTA